jgi:hypothetical protein
MLIEISQMDQDTTQKKSKCLEDSFVKIKSF